MEEIWRTRDRFGRTVILTPAKLEHIRARHGDFAERFDDIRIVIEHPDFVTRDRLRQHRECFYRYEASGNGLIKSVIQYRPAPPQGTWIGEVVTAFHIGIYRSREVQLWP